VATVQGDFQEHIDITQRALQELGLKGQVVPLRTGKDAEQADAVILPGGESTAISKLLVRFGAMPVLRRRVQDEDFPILGTCAGAILLSKEGDEQVAKTKTELLGVMDIAVDRNAFGRQRESFETDLKLKGFARPVHAVFIRAPAIQRVWGTTEVLGTYNDRIVAARQGRRWALAFHPELTQDTSIHVAFLKALG